jgi:hypothetical protein
MRSRAKWLPVALLGLLTGCVGSARPLTDPAPSDADKPLYGRWEVHRGDHREVLEFAPPNEATPKTELPDQRLMVMSHYEYARDGQHYSRRDRRAFVTTAGGKTFLNAYTEKSKGAVPCPPREFDIPAWFEFNLYKLDGDTLDVWTMDDATTLKAVRKGLIRGEEWPKGDPDPSGVLVEGGRPMLDFLTGKDGPSVFLDSGKTRYTRVKDKKE